MPAVDPRSGHLVIAVSAVSLAIVVLLVICLVCGIIVLACVLSRADIERVIDPPAPHQYDLDGIARRAFGDEVRRAHRQEQAATLALADENAGES